MEPIKEFLLAHGAEILTALVAIRSLAAIARTRVPNDGSKADGVLDVIEALFHWAKIAEGWAKMSGRPEVAAVLGVIAGPDDPPASPVAPRLADVVTLPLPAPSTEPVTLDLTRDVPPALQPAVSPPANSNPQPPDAA